MDYKSYQTLAQRTSSTHSEADKVVNGCMGLIGEAGQVVDVVKKRLFQGYEISKATEKLKSEVGDVLWYCAELCTGLNIHMDELMLTTDSVCIMTASKYQSMTMAQACVKLSCAAAKPYQHFCDDYPLSLDDFQKKLCDIPMVISICNYILQSFCGSDVDQCMTQNIEKLKARYPQGFDAERSNNRAPGDQ